MLAINPKIVNIITAHCNPLFFSSKKPNINIDTRLNKDSLIKLMMLTILYL
jgi:hypothetical protein